jgi:hypothetical protein
MYPTTKSFVSLLRQLHSGRHSATDFLFKETTADTDTLLVWIITAVEELHYAYQIGNFDKQWYQSSPTATLLGLPSQYIQQSNISEEQPHHCKKEVMLFCLPFV